MAVAAGADLLIFANLKEPIPRLLVPAGAERAVREGRIEQRRIGEAYRWIFVAKKS